MLGGLHERAEARRLPRARCAGLGDPLVAPLRDPHEADHAGGEQAGEEASQHHLGSSGEGDRGGDEHHRVHGRRRRAGTSPPRPAPRRGPRAARRSAPSCTHSPGRATPAAAATGTARTGRAGSSPGQRRRAARRPRWRRSRTTPSTRKGSAWTHDRDEDRGPALEGVGVERSGDERAHQRGADHEPDEHRQGSRPAGAPRGLRRVGGRRGGHLPTVGAATQPSPGHRPVSARGLAPLTTPRVHVRGSCTRRSPART